MSEKLEVEELRAQLELRGLESTGIKRTLVSTHLILFSHSCTVPSKLDAALSKEKRKYPGRRCSRNLRWDRIFLSRSCTRSQEEDKFTRVDFVEKVV
ncbi:unnamed protein product [Spirodela intermedia]|uniref:SAP domain-containing protein n=1 Tax=Spirodela intermedia TaxID=51605 RepID=A0ABN7EAW7_SPIIN|nr:unnamed protein product [Spirodela intermedia]